MRPSALCLLAAGLACSASAAFAQESQPAHENQSAENENSRLLVWKWANFAVLAGGIAYLVSKNGGPFFATRSRQIRKDMIEAAEVRKEAEQRAAVVDRKLASLASDIERLKAESAQEREAETERLRRHRESEREKIQAHAQREIDSAGNAARLELKRYAAVLAIHLAEQKIRARMNGETQDVLVEGFVSRLASPISLESSRN